MNLTEEKKLQILLAIGGFIVGAIIYLLLFSFDTNFEREQKKIGFIILGDINEQGWNSSHYNGIKSACEDFNLELLVKDHVKENSGQCAQAVEELVTQGADLIILASFGYPTEIGSVMEKYSDVAFISLSPAEERKNLTSCFTRLYQGRYLSGVLAGMKTKNNKLGYVAAMPNAEVNRGINAFALGVQRVNPDAKVLVMFTDSWQDEEVEEKNTKILAENYGADVLTYHQDEETVARVAEKLGVDFIAYNSILENCSDHYLTSIVCSWDLFYKDILQRYLKGELVSIRNNWIGVQQGAISLSKLSNSVTPKIQDKVNEVYEELAGNKNLIFVDEIYDNEGNLRCGKNQVISDMELLRNIGWLVKGVEVVK